jgi:hypothetical protein
VCVGVGAASLEMQQRLDMCGGTRGGWLGGWVAMVCMHTLSHIIGLANSNIDIDLLFDDIIAVVCAVYNNNTITH